MRVLSGSRNRVTLASAGLLLLIAGAWLIGVSFALITPGGPLGALAVTEGATVSSVFDGHSWWLLPAAIAVAILAALAGLILLIAQIPRAPVHTVLRLHDDDGTVLAAVEPQVLERALAERAESVPGVDEASVRVSGSAAAPRVIAEVTVAESAEVAWAVGRARQRLTSDVATSLGTDPLSVDVLVTLRNDRSGGRADRVSVRGRDAERVPGAV